MEATFVGRLGQKVHMEGNPMQIATTYAYLMAADVQGIRAMEQNNKDNNKSKSHKNGGYTELPYDIVENGESPEEIINGLLDWINEQRRKDDGDEGEE